MKNVQILLFAVALLASIPAGAAPKTTNKINIEGINYTFDPVHMTAVVDVTPKLDGEVIIPEEIEIADDHYTVIGIGEKAFKGGKSITGFVVPKTLRFVYRSAFVDTEWFQNDDNWGEKGTLYLDSILISVDPDSTKSRYYIQEGTSIIAIDALLDCKDIMTQVWIPNSVKEIAPGNFRNCKMLKKFHFPRTLKRIGKGAFKGTAAYANESFWKKGVLYIDSCLIEGSKDMKPDYVVRPSYLMADGAFQGNPVLHHIVLDNRYKYIGEETFAGCPLLEHVDMPEAVEEIRDFAFADCASIEKIRFSSNIKYIGVQAFSGCSKLQELRLPKKLEVIDERAFYRCTFVGGINEWPVKLREIKKGAFCECSNLMELNKIPATLSKLGEAAFAGCASLREIKLPDSICTILPQTFAGCRDLHKVILAPGTYDISDYAFQGCINLDFITLPESMFRIGKGAFKDCSMLQLRLVDHIHVIEEGAFQNCASLEHLDIPIKLKTIESRVFSGCKLLQTVRFHSKFESIDPFAFENCTYLKAVFIPEDTEVHKDAFKGNKTEVEYVDRADKQHLRIVKPNE